MSDQSNRQDDTKQDTGVPEPAREYAKPALTPYGSVAKLTQNMVGSQIDAGQGNRRAPCL